MTSNDSVYHPASVQSLRWALAIHAFGSARSRIVGTFFTVGAILMGGAILSKAAIGVGAVLPVGARSLGRTYRDSGTFLDGAAVPAILQPRYCAAPMTTTATTAAMMRKGSGSEYENENQQDAGAGQMFPRLFHCMFLHIIIEFQRSFNYKYDTAVKILA